MQSGVLQVEHSEKSLIEKALSEEAKKDISSDKMKKVTPESQFKQKLVPQKKATRLLQTYSKEFSNIRPMQSNILLCG